jgi:methyltransferase (TIGR00027 family)
VRRLPHIDEKLIETPGDIDAVGESRRGLRYARLPAAGAGQHTVWEIDQPENIEIKRARLQRRLGAAPVHVTLMPVDLDRQDAGAVLTSHGYTTTARTFFIWEGVTQYP